MSCRGADRIRRLCLGASSHTWMNAVSALNDIFCLEAQRRQDLLACGGLTAWVRRTSLVRHVRIVERRVDKELPSIAWALWCKACSAERRRRMDFSFCKAIVFLSQLVAFSRSPSTVVIAAYVQRHHKLHLTIGRCSWVWALRRDVSSHRL